MKNFYTDGSNLFQDDRAQGLTEWFDEYENYLNHILWPSQLTHMYNYGRFEQICYTSCHTAIKTPNEEEWFHPSSRVPLVESMQR